jgi:tetratricopeptide (TPR) repeat protein
MPFAAMAPVGAGPFMAPFNPGLPGVGAAPMGRAADRGPRTTVALVPGRRPAAVELPGIAAEDALGRGQLGAPSIDGAVEVAIRTSNAPARARAARLVAIGDRHLRDAITDPAKLAKAIDAYRRAASIAPDQPDTFLRQAIAFTAAGKGTAAATAVGRAVAIDPRLAEGGGAKGVGIASAFGGRAPADAVPPLAARSRKLLTRIFADSTATPEPPAENWIADRWLGRVAGPVMVAARP